MNENQSVKNVDALKKLKKILLTDDQRRINQLEKQLELLRSQYRNKEQLIQTLNPVIAELIANKIHSSKDEMAEVLAPVMGKAIKKQIENAKDDVVDALYPVIGKTIRRSIAEAMKNLAEMVNRKIENALRMNLLFIKLKSKITGVPEEQIFLKSALPFYIHDIFYIHKETGILISHVSNKKDSHHADEDIISGMLTAIRDFSKNAFAEDEDRDLKEIEYDDRQIILEGGPHAYLAFVVSGVYPDHFGRAITNLESALHKQYGLGLRSFNGDVTAFSSIEKQLENFIQKYTNTDVDMKNQPSKHIFPTGLISILILIVLIIITIVLFYPKEPLDSNQSIIENETITITNQNKIFEQLQLEIGNQLISDLSKIKLIIHDETLILQGPVISESERVFIASAISRISDYPVILNNLKVIGESHDDLGIENIVIYFDKQKSDLDLNARLKLNVVQKHLSNIQYNKFIVFGHSDSLGSVEYNRKISLERANVVKSYLIENGIDNNKIECKAKADSLPISSNKTVQGQALNRRVTFILKN